MVFRFAGAYVFDTSLYRCQLISATPTGIYINAESHGALLKNKEATHSITQTVQRHTKGNKPLKWLFLNRPCGMTKWVALLLGTTTIYQLCAPMHFYITRFIIKKNARLLRRALFLNSITAQTLHQYTWMRFRTHCLVVPARCNRQPLRRFCSYHRRVRFWDFGPHKA